MFLDALATARDWSVILLAIELLILGAIPLVALYYITRGLRQMVGAVGPLFRNVRLRIEGFFQVIDRFLRSVAAPFVWAHGSWARAETVLGILSGRRRVEHRDGI